MLVQNNFKLNYVERGLSHLCVGTGNSHVRFYDVTSWSYVNLDDPNSSADGILKRTLSLSHSIVLYSAL